MVVSKRDDCVKGYSIVILTGDGRPLVRAFRAFRAFLRQVTRLIGLADVRSSRSDFVSLWHLSIYMRDA